MDVHGVGNGHGSGLGRTRGREGQTEPAPQPATTQSTQTTSNAGSVAPSVEPTDAQRGVIRNLLDGHFRGVADARLRINFREEILAIQQSTTAGDAERQVNGIVASIEVRVEAFVDVEDLTDEDIAAIREGLEGFVDAARQALSDFLGDEENANDTEALFESVGAALQNFIADLVSLLGEEEPAEETAIEQSLAEAGETDIPPETAEEPPLPLLGNLEQLVQDLNEAFTNGRTAFVNQLASSSALPELSEPNGNGVAYSRFVSILESLETTQENTLSEVSSPEDIV